VTAQPGNPIAVSSWSVNGQLESGAFTLDGFPGELKRRGYDRAELCHFHLTGNEPAHLAPIRAAFEAAGVSIQTLLIDDGDITNPQTRDRDLAWIESWIAAAAHLGASHARVIAGKQPATPETLALSISGLKQLAACGKRYGVRIVTENWFETLGSAREVHHVLDSVGSDLGFLVDMGNWIGPGKYAELASVFARAERCHAKASFGPGLAMDETDFGRCVKAAVEASYTGPYTLIFESEGDEWQGLDVERRFIIDTQRQRVDL
jgi:sugar phosphate isomerase/epimerase